jgi:hypothetical protein
VSLVRAALVLACAFAASNAWADRIAVLAIESPSAPPPVVQADHVAAALLTKGHRVVAPADAASRLTSGDAGAGPDWAARQLQAIDAARAALTRLDRRFALMTETAVSREIIGHGGGAGGADVIVAWCLLERQLALTAADAAGAARWLDRAVAAAPGSEIDPLRHPEAERDAFSRRRGVLLAETPATLSISSVPAAADVWIDGVHRCSAPCAPELVPGRHLVLITSPAHAPAILDVETLPGTEQKRQVALSAAYAGASTRAIAAMLADPSRRREAVTALEPVAKFLDVDHVVALAPEGDQAWRVLVAPPARGRSAFGPAVSERDLDTAVADQLRPTEAATEASSPWYGKPAVWLGGAAVVGAVVAGVLVYGATRPAKTGTLTIGSP